MPSPAPSPPAVRRVRKRLADGSIKVYEYATAPKPRVRATMAADSLRELLAAYERSPEWRGMAHRTRRNKLIALRHLHPIQHLSVAGLKRRDILTLRDAIAEGIGPGAANGFASAIAALLSWARDRGWIEASPADRIKAIPGGHFPTWSEEALAAALGAVPEPIRRALALAVHTGQRRGDLCMARWSDFRGGVWRVRQEKSQGKTALVIPLHPDLAAELEAWRQGATAVTVLTQADGTPWNRDWLTMSIMRAVTPLGLKGHNIHGLRKLAAVRLAEAGCSAHEIASITGHKSLAQVELYTAAADQERLARGAVIRLQAVSSSRKKPAD
jgi:integrase